MEAQGGMKSSAGSKNKSIGSKKPIFTISTPSPRISGVGELTPIFTAHKAVEPKSMSTKSIHRHVYHNNDMLWISREIKGIYKPHGLPKELNKLHNLIKYSDGIELRKICNFLRANQWAYISEKKLQFREAAWEKMGIDQMPSGRIKENFINAFVTYLPYISHLPINNKKTVPCMSRNPT